MRGTLDEALAGYGRGTFDQALGGTFDQALGGTFDQALGGTFDQTLRGTLGACSAARVRLRSAPCSAAEGSATLDRLPAATPHMGR